MLTTVIIIVTSIISILTFNNAVLQNKLIFYPPEIKRGGWYRFVTYGLIHADYTHLIFNMLTLYFFGVYIEKLFANSFGDLQGRFWYLFLYVSAIIVSIFPTYRKQRNESGYRSLGASGAVSAIVFAFILVNPMSFMGIMFIPVMLPAFLFGIIYILISIGLDKQQAGNINHSAHITGSIYGMIFIVVLFALLGHVNVLKYFIEQIHISSLSDLIHVGF